jgi:hypothetical protein
MSLSILPITRKKVLACSNLFFGGKFRFFVRIKDITLSQFQVDNQITESPQRVHNHILKQRNEGNQEKAKRSRQ